MIGMFNHIRFNIQKGYYTCIGSGSSRDVFDLENGYVVKVAKNRAGIAQNESEYNISQYDSSGLFAEVVQVSNDFAFLIMKKARKIYDISIVWEYFNVKDKRELFKLKEMQDIKRKYNLILADLNKASSWGIINGRPVIIDYGYTSEVRQKYYRK